MRKAEYLKQLSDAADLLVMLEQLAQGCEEDEGRKIPWGGMRITLAQARTLVQQSLDTLSRGGRGEQPQALGDGAMEEPVQRGVSALAGRIQRAPTAAGRIRELVPPPAGPGKQLPRGSDA